MFIQIYVYDKTTGQYLYQDVGNPNGVIRDLSDDKDFTLTPPPDNVKPWRWIDDKWITA
ncbi:hypothetical protein LU293_04150 [Moraxella nasovis]|uniref:hypothetical protein n=1 Tax=Moraxella nasovis TaxID=2904121 RepID=UPI001F617CA1|nr:hypothetical protein [Moraxella nasovis]UNU74094.1 hypothetical protein LU293_04150 [Moraxella nasovis]